VVRGWSARCAMKPSSFLSPQTFPHLDSFLSIFLTVSKMFSQFLLSPLSSLRRCESCKNPSSDPAHAPVEHDRRRAVAMAPDFTFCYHARRRT
jgi:hypothetical protein